MEETQRIKDEGYLGFRLENDIYYFVDFKRNEVLNTMDEVAFLFDIGTRPVLLKWGHPDKVNDYAGQTRRVYAQNGFDDMAMDLVVIQGKFPIEEIDKMLSISGYMMKVKE